jgi:hypothetical protein
MKKLIIAAMTVAVLGTASTSASAQVCPFATVVAALTAAAQQHRELTQEEASWCGVPFFFQQPQQPKTKKKHRTQAKQH